MRIFYFRNHSEMQNKRDNLHLLVEEANTIIILSPTADLLHRNIEYELEMLTGTVSVTVSPYTKDILHSTKYNYQYHSYRILLYKYIYCYIFSRITNC